MINFELEFDLKVLGYYEDSNFISCSVNELPSLTKLSKIKLECNHCKRTFDRGLYHLDYGCSHGNRKSPKFLTGELDTKFGILGYDSSYELKFIESIIKLDLLTHIESQPKDYVIEYLFNNELHHYYPDFYLIYNNNKYIIEIKPSTIVDNDVIQSKIKSALEYCISRSMTYIVSTDDDLFYGDPSENLMDRLINEDNKLQLNELK